MPSDDELNQVCLIYDDVDDNEYISLSMANTDYNGDCVIIKTNNGKIVMSDTGYSSDVVKNSIKNIMEKYNKTHVDYLIISHYHSDHVGNMDWLIDNGYVDSDTIIYVPSEYNSSVIDTFDSDARVSHPIFVNAISRINVTQINPSDFDVLEVDNVKFIFFNTNHNKIYEMISNGSATRDYNQCSLSFRMEYGNKSFVSTGDGCGVLWKQYYKNMKKCDIYKAYHHAVDSASTEVLNDSYAKKFMDAILPDMVITSLGNGLSVSDRFIQNNAGIQEWCENNCIPNYIVGHEKQGQICLRIYYDSIMFESNSRRCIR